MSIISLFVFAFLLFLDRGGKWLFTLRTTNLKQLFFGVSQLEREAGVLLERVGQIVAKKGRRRPETAPLLYPAQRQPRPGLAQHFRGRSVAGICVPRDPGPQRPAVFERAQKAQVENPFFWDSGDGPSPGAGRESAS